MKKLLLVALLIVAMVFSMAACTDSGNKDSGTEPPANESTDTDADAETGTAVQPADMNIQVIAKGFQHQFWQVVKKGAEDAAKALGVGKMDFNGPEGESAINTQVDMLKSALAQGPNAIALAALDTKAVTAELDEAKGKNIPIIGFDSGVPDAPEGVIKATASTNNEVAAAIAADEMMKNAAFKAAVEGATADKPVTIAILSQDATSASITGRTKGFLDKIKALAEATHTGAVEVTGHDMYKSPSSEKAAVTIMVQVPPTPDAADMKNGAQAVLNAKDLVGIFLSNEGAVTGLLSATNDGTDLGSKYKGVVVAGFDAGKTQKSVVEKGLFLGSVTQDPYQIGYQAVDLAVKAARGETVSDVDTGAKWYNKDNMKEADIAQLLYD